MAFELATTVLGTQVANADFSASSNQFRAVKLNSSGKVVLCTAAGEKILGILVGKPGADEAADVVVEAAACMALAGAAVAAGALVMTGADGRIITAATTGSTIIGWALEAAAAAGEIFTIRLAPASGVV